MKKLIVTGLLTAMLSISSVCSAAWVYVGNYVVDKEFEKMVGNPEYVYSTIYNLNPMPSDHVGVFYKLYYSDGYELRKSAPNSEAYYVGLKVRTCLLPTYSNGGSASKWYGWILDDLNIASKGAFGVFVTKHEVIDMPPKVQEQTTRYTMDFTNMNGVDSAQLGVLKRGSAIEAVTKHIDSGIAGF